MSLTLLVKRNNTLGTVPTAASLAVGELALNTVDGNLRAKINGVVQRVRADIGLYTAAVDFGTLPVSTGVFQVSVADAIVGDVVICSVSSVVPGSMPDELEMDPLSVFGRVIQTGVIEFLVTTTLPLSCVTGQRYLNFYMG